MTKILDSLHSLEDLRSLDIPEFTQLSQEIRELIIDVVSKQGGHLASNLGVVELTIAILNAYNPPRDKIIWDVSHQTYPYKILTDRRDKFHTLRQYQGIKGFSSPEESPFDAFGTGHSSTSISAALGMAFAREQHKDRFDIAVVIGDGAMTGGMVYEALNNIERIRDNLLIILNDNEMSIASNVGGISKYFNKLITGHYYNIAKGDIEDFVKRRFAALGEKILKISHRVEESIKGLILPGLVFEEFGLRYFGPLDGHNLEILVPLIKRLKAIKGPVLLHLITKKGKGYPPSERNPEFFHSAPMFNVATGKAKKKKTTFTSVFGDTICQIAAKDKSVIAITAAMPAGTGLSKFAKQFPKRFLDVGIAEQHAVTTAAGMAIERMRPVVAIYSTFLQRAFDQIIHDVALQKLPVVFCIDRAGIVGSDGPTHHGVFDITYLRLIPNMIIMSPRNGVELRNMLHTAINYNKGPIAIRYPRGECESIDNTKPFEELAIGEPEIVIKGEGAAIIAIGPFVEKAIAAAKILEAQGKKITVVNARFVKPFNIEALEDIMTNHSLVYTLEDNVISGGFGSAINEQIVLHKLGKTYCITLGYPDLFIEHATPDILYKKYNLTPEKIAERIAKEMKP